MYQILRDDIGMPVVVERQGMNQVGLTLLETFRSLIPLLHQVTVRNLQTVENHVQHLDVIAIGLSLVVVEFIGREFPVAYDDERMLLSIFMYLLCAAAEAQ